MRIAGILLAAGSATRFRGDKPLAPLGPGTSGIASAGAVGVVAAMHLCAALPDAVAVVARNDAPLAQRLRDAGLRIVECAGARSGIGASIGCGVTATAYADGWVIALADMPWIAPATIGAVAIAIAEGAAIAAPVYRGERGHPVGFGRLHFASLSALAGDTGARSIIERHRETVTLIDVGDAGILRDVDVPADLPGGGP